MHFRPVQELLGNNRVLGKKDWYTATLLSRHFLVHPQYIRVHMRETYSGEMAGITTKALFMRIVPAGGGKEFNVERWKKLPDTEAARKEYNAVEFSDDFYERHPDKKAVIYNRDLLDEMVCPPRCACHDRTRIKNQSGTDYFFSQVMHQNANNVADGGDYIKFKSDQHEQGLIDLNVMRGLIEKYRDPPCSN